MNWASKSNFLTVDMEKGGGREKEHEIRSAGGVVQGICVEW